MARWFVLTHLCFLVLAWLVRPAWAQVPTCDEQVALLQGYVQELGIQRSTLEGRLVKMQQAAQATASLPDVKAKIDYIEQEKARMEKAKADAVKTGQGGHQ